MPAWHLAILVQIRFGLLPNEASIGRGIQKNCLGVIAKESLGTADIKEWGFKFCLLMTPSPPPIVPL